MEDRFNKTGRLEKSDGGGFFFVSENGGETSADQELISIWSMFNNKTVDEIADLIMNDKNETEARKHIGAIASGLEKSGLLVKV